MGEPVSPLRRSWIFFLFCFPFSRPLRTGLTSVAPTALKPLRLLRRISCLAFGAVEGQDELRRGKNRRETFASLKVTTNGEVSLAEDFAEAPEQD